MVKKNNKDEEGTPEVVKIQEKYVLSSSVVQRIRNFLNESQPENSNYGREQRLFDAKFSDNFEDILLRKSKNLGPQRVYGKNVTIRATFQKNANSQLPDLPIFSYRNEILSKIFNETFTLISGDTGCGKSTQVSQMILDYFLEIGRSVECNIICTQPRRISAIAIAERVAFERNEEIADKVGYQIRLESALPNVKSGGTIIYCTTGVLLRKMENDPLLTKVSHVILDEIHERSIELDLLIGLLKKVVQYNKNLKIILMSATFGIGEFVEYFDNCSVIQIPGKLYPVDVKYLEDILQFIPFDFKKIIDSGKYTDKEKKEFKNIIEPYALELHKNGKTPYEVINAITNVNSEGVHLLFIKTLIFYIANNQPEGAILIFLPGYDKIEFLYHMIVKSDEYSEAKFKIYTLHSLMPTERQRDIFVRPPKGVRKIILSTTIAETSLTIDDVVYVINPGRVKETGYDLKNNYETLVEKWISEAQFVQRKGRAGRCQRGICYNLYTRARANAFAQYPVPEIQRNRLESVILRLKFMCIENIYEFLQTLLDCPDKTLLEYGYQLLKRINALNSDQKITPLGYHMARLPLDPQISKMLVISSIFECIEPITSICATLSYKEPFYRSIKYGGNHNLKDIKLEFANDAYSDELMFAYVMEDYSNAVQENSSKQFVRDNFLSFSILNQLEGFKYQLNEILKSVNLTTNYSNANSKNEHLLRGVITAGLYPNIAYIKNAKKNEKKITQDIITPEDNKKVVLHKWTVNANLCEFNSMFLVYARKRMGKNEICLYDSTMVYPDALFIFSDTFETVQKSANEYIIKISDNIEFLTDLETFEIITTLRYRFEKLLTKLALNQKKSKSDLHLLKALILFLSCDLD